ncbi:hypothetical protein PFISCL1PPCAC_2552, partial [Pristionchus fissidentatus]
LSSTCLFPSECSVGLVVGTILTSIGADWQWSIRVVPMIGLPVMILTTVFLKEPVRGGNEEKSKSDEEQPEKMNFFENLKVILPIKTYWFSVGAM